MLLQTNFVLLDNVSSAISGTTVHGNHILKPLLHVCCPFWLNPLCQGQFQLIALLGRNASASSHGSRSVFCNAGATRAGLAISCLVVPNRHVCYAVTHLLPVSSLQSLYMQLETERASNDTPLPHVVPSKGTKSCAGFYDTAGLQQLRNHLH